MYYNVKVNGRNIICKDFLYDMNKDDGNRLSLFGVWYGSEDYKYLVELMDEVVSVELICDGLVFARFTGVELKRVKYHLVDEDVSFDGCFDVYVEDLSVLEDIG